ncbi:hypothetical protein KQX54_007705 [Cotesia glomerata]|uniref:Glycogen [starch] synthase n=1 Tax=Cotesia glomerata TaxID=32391 RepID=A0AAV7IXL6_COTGL|nr:hypothetical protein KQX54_007705 [Cotesia glomerata]
MSRERASRRFYRIHIAHDLSVYMDRGRNAEQENRWSFEVAWEVANKVGGIYTIIRSKAYVSTEELGDRYCMMGPYKEQSARTEVEQAEFPHHTKYFFLSVVTGTWLVDGNPQVILFDIGSTAWKLDEYKSELWNTCNIGIPHLDNEANDAVILGYLVCQFITEFRKAAEESSSVQPRVLVHCHEWQAGLGLVALRTRDVDVATIFTTHSTLLGRYLCAGKIDFYNNLDKFNVDEEAGKRQIYHRYCMERVAAHLCHIFTTVSDITGIEVEHLLKRKPDIITPNGLNVKKFSVLHEFQKLHTVNKKKIHEFVRVHFRGHFYGHFDFDLDKTLYFFTAGRYEFGNKRADIFIEALARLNYYLKTSKPDITVVAFLIFPARTNNFNVESLRGHAVTKSLRDTIYVIQQNVGKRMYESCLSGRLPDAMDMLLKDEIIKIKRCLYGLQRSGLPPVTTQMLLMIGMIQF